MATRKQRQAKAIDNITQADIDYMVNYFDGKCAYCSATLTPKSGYDNSLNIDHYISLAEQDKGDENEILVGLTPENSIPSCRECNLNKHSQNPEKWIKNYFPNAEIVLERIENYLEKQRESLFL